MDAKLKTTIIELGVISFFSTLISSFATQAFENNKILLGSLSAGVGAIIGFALLKIVIQLNRYEEKRNEVIYFCLILSIPFFLYFLTHNIFLHRLLAYKHHVITLLNDLEEDAGMFKISLEMAIFIISATPSSLILHFYNFSETPITSYGFKSKTLEGCHFILILISFFVTWIILLMQFANLGGWVFNVNKGIAIIPIYLIAVVLAIIFSYLFTRWLNALIFLFAKTSFMKVLTTDNRASFNSLFSILDNVD
jgi:hypothetical protein